MDQATSARHRNTIRPKTPRAAPTAMKMVPSGTLETWRYGAPAAGGTCGVGMLNSGGRLRGGSSLIDGRLGLPAVVGASVVRGGRLVGSVRVGFSVSCDLLSSVLETSVGFGLGSFGLVTGGLGLFVGSFGLGLFVGRGSSSSGSSGTCAPTLPTRTTRHRNSIRSRNGLEASPRERLMVGKTQKPKMTCWGGGY